MKCDVTVTVDAIVGQLESGGAATVVGAHRVLAIVSAESLIIPALVHIYRRGKRRHRGEIMNSPTQTHGHQRILAIPDAPSQRFVPLLKKKPFLHSQWYVPNRLMQM